jgi:hypothetical protein
MTLPDPVAPPDVLLLRRADWERKSGALLAGSLHVLLPGADFDTVTNGVAWQLLPLLKLKLSPDDAVTLWLDKGPHARDFDLHLLYQLALNAPIIMAMVFPTYRVGFWPEDSDDQVRRDAAKQRKLIRELAAKDRGVSQ